MGLEAFGCCVFIFKTSFEMEHISPTHLSSQSSMYSLRSLVSLVSRSDLLIQQEPDSEVVMAPVY